MPDFNKEDKPKSLSVVTEQDLLQAQKTIEESKLKPSIGLGGLDTGSSIGGAVPQHYQKAADKAGWNYSNIPDNAATQSYLNQSTGGVLWNGLKGFGYQALAGVFTGISELDLEGQYDMAMGNYEKQYGNWASEIATKILDADSRDNQIYTDPNNSMSNVAYWANQFKSFGLTAGIIAESFGEQALLSYLTGGTGNAAALSMKARLLRSIKATSLFGAAQGIKEAFSNGLETMASTYQEAIDMGMSEEEAQQAAARAATIGYRTEIGPLMVINALQYAGAYGSLRSMKTVKSGRGVSLGQGYGSIIESGLEHITKGISNKYVRGALKYGSEAISEGFEEGLQTGIQAYASNKVLTPNKKLDVFNKNTRDGIIAGAFGGLLFKASGSIFRGMDNKISKNSLEGRYNKFLNDTGNRTFNRLKELKTATDSFNLAKENFKVNPSEDTAKILSRARVRYESSLKNTGVQDSYNALFLDYLKGEDFAFESHVNNLEQLYNTIENGTIEEKTKRGLIDEKGNEIYSDVYDDIKKQLLNNIESAKILKSGLENNLVNITSDFDSAWDITHKEFLNKDSNKVIGETYEKISNNLNNDTQFGLLSSDGQRRFKTEQEIQSLQEFATDNKLFESNSSRLSTLENELSNMEDYSSRDKSIINTIDNSNNNLLLYGINYANQSIDQNNKDLIKLKDRKEIQKKISERKQKEALEKAKTVDNTNVQEVKEELRETGQLTPEVNTEIEKKLTEENTGNFGWEEATQNLRNNIRERNSEIMDSLNSLAENLGNNGFQTVDDSFFTEETPIILDGDRAKELDNIASRNEALTLQPIIRDASNPKHSAAVEQYAQTIKELNDSFQELHGEDISPEEMFKLFANQVGIANAERRFNFFKDAYSSVLPSKFNWDNLYNKYFKALQGFDLKFNESPTVEDVKQEEKEVAKVIAEKAPPISYSPENSPIKYNGWKISTPVNKVPFLGINYEVVTNGDGTVSFYDTSNSELNMKGNNVHIFLNYNLLSPGRQFRAVIPDNWQELSTTEWSYTTEGILVGKETTMAQWVAKDPENRKEGSDAWIAKVPIQMEVDGQNVGYAVHDTDWWNTRNVADFRTAKMDGETVSEEQAKALQEKLILEGRAKVFEIRKQIYSGNNTLKVLNRYPGITNNNQNDELKSLQDSNPDIQVVIASGSGLITSYKNGKAVPFGGMIVNEKDINLNGSIGKAFMISQLGTTSDKDGNSIPLYVANQVITNHNQESLREVKVSMDRMLNAVDTVNKFGAFSNPSQEQIEWAEKVIKGVKSITGISIDKMEGSAHTGLDGFRETYPQLSKKTQGEMLLQVQMRNINKPLAIVDENGNVTNYKSEAGEGYKAMLMDNLYTHRRFYKIPDASGNPMYIQDVQPRIEIGLANEEVEIPGVKVDIQTGEVTPIIENVNAEEINDQSITEITTGQRRRVVEFIYNRVFNEISNLESFTNTDVLNAIEKSFDTHLKLIHGTPEYNYLSQNRDAILGIGNHKDDFNTVTKNIEAFLNQELDNENEVELNEGGEFIKNNDKSSFEIKASLSTRLKMYFSGVAVKSDDKTISTPFAGLPSFYTTDEVMEGLQNMLVNIPNDMESFKNKVKDSINKNEREFGFLKSLELRLEKAPKEIQREILYRLNQTKNEMYFVMWSKLRNGSKLQVLDANSRNPVIKLRSEIRQNFKQIPLIDSEKNSYTINEKLANSLIEQFDTWKNNYDSISNKEYSDWLSQFGIDVSEETIADLRLNNAFSSLFTKNGGVFGRLYQNLKDGLDKQKTGPLLFEDSGTNKAFSLVFNENNNFLDTLIKTEVNNTFNLSGSMYIGGKTINAFSQPNYASEQVRKIKALDEGLIRDLQESPYTRDNIYIRLLQESKDIKDNFGIAYVSLEAFKQRKQKVYQDNSITSLSSQDYDTTLLGFFQNLGKTYKLDEYENKFEVRQAKMTFPTLSDSSQMFLLDVPVFRLTTDHVSFNSSNDTSLNRDTLDLMFHQIVKPDLNKISAYIGANQTLNVKGQNLGSQLFTNLHTLNYLMVDYNGRQESLLSVIINRLKAGDDIDTIIEPYKSAIYNEIESVVNRNVNSKVRYESGEVRGEWVNNGYYDGKNIQILDTKYLDKTHGKNNFQKLKIAAYDYAVNYMIAQSQMQGLFAGDISNYVEEKGKITKLFSKDVNGNVDAASPILPDGMDKTSRYKFVYDTVMQSASVNMSKRLKELISPGNRLANSFSEDSQYLQVMVEDVERASSTILNLAELFYPETYSENTQDFQDLLAIDNAIQEAQRNNSAEDSIADLIKGRNNIVDKLAKKFPEISAYLNITATDAQEYTTWEEHLNVLENQGRVTESMADSIRKKLTSQSKDGVNNTNRLSKEERKVVFQPIKPLHAGMYFDSVTNEDNIPMYKNQRFVYVKTSSFPLLPETTQGHELDRVRTNLEELENGYRDSNGVVRRRVRMSYQSGNKVGAVRKAIPYGRMLGDMKDIQAELMNSSVLLDRGNFSIQQDKPFKTDKNIKSGKRDEVNRGTQFEKIILGNGINQIENKIFPANFDEELLNSLNIKPENGNISGKDLYSIYTELYNREQNLKQQALYSSLGLREDGTWENGIQALEEIQSALDKRLPNQQDKDSLDLVYVVPNENGENLYLTKEELGSLVSTRAEFKLPIWITPNSRKFESVLNSMVKNAMIRLKFPGFSSPVASEQGFKLTEDTNISGINYLKGYNPKEGLKATYVTNENGEKVLQKAQVLVASKFRDEKGNIITDINKVDPELLASFSFRIPTSAHQSGAIIEIVGFLPHEQGDLMIVPKDHATQIGEDYDIDTRYVYGQNYYVDRDGFVKKINSEYINDKIKEIEAKSGNDIELNKFYQNLLNQFNVFNTDDEMQTLFEDDRISIDRKKNMLISKFKGLLVENQLIDMYKSVYTTTDTNMQRLINSTLSTDFAGDTADLIDGILSGNKDFETIFDDRHQKSILRLGASGKLGIGVHSNWVVLNALFQQMVNRPKLFNGFNDVTGEEVPFKMRIGSFESDGTLGQIEALRPKYGRYKGFTPRLLSTINMENQNCATDNQKLQIMGKRNENKYTINVLALMSNLGFDKDTLTLENGETMDVSLPSLFISQPIIRRYVELKESYNSITNEYTPEIENEIKQRLIKEFGNGVRWATKSTEDGEIDLVGIMDNQIMEEVEANLTAQTLYDNLINYSNENQWAVFEKFKALDIKSADITKAQQLINIESDGLGISQFDTIEKKNSLLFDMNAITLNIKNIEDLFGDYTDLELPTESEESQEKFLGEVKNLESQGYKFISSSDNTAYFIKPTSPQSIKVVNAISTGYNLWKNVFPFESKFIQEQIRTIQTIAGKKSGTVASKELNYKVLSEMKDYFYSLGKLGIYTNGDSNYERQRLFMDSSEGVSLAAYLNKLKRDKHPLFKEAFFRDLEFDLNGTVEPSIIKYSTSDKTNFNKNEVYSILKELNNSTEVLPAFKGDSNYNYEKLAKDLASYSLLANQENGAIGFRQYIPMEVLERYGVDSSLRVHAGVGKLESQNLLFNGYTRGLMSLAGATRIENNSFQVNNPDKAMIRKYVDTYNTTKFSKPVFHYNEDTNTITFDASLSEDFTSVFVKQFFQHNPNEAKKLNISKKKDWMVNAEQFTGKVSELDYFKAVDSTPDFVAIRDSERGVFELYQRDSNGVHQKINRLGGFGFNEYSPFSLNQKSIDQENNIKEVSIKTVPTVVTSNTQTIDNTNSNVNSLSLDTDIFTVLNTIANRPGSKYQQLASIISGLVNDGKVNVVDLKGIANGIYVPLKGDSTIYTHPTLGNLNRGEIYIDKTLVSQGNVNDIEYAMLEEIVHSQTVDELNKYIDTSDTYLDSNGDLEVKWLTEDVPTHIYRLVDLFKSASKALVDEYTKEGMSLQDTINKINAQRRDWNNNASDVIASTPQEARFKMDVYRIINLKEFVAGVLVDEDFRRILDKVPYKGGSVLSKFADLIRRLFEYIAPNSVKGSISKYGTDAILSLLEVRKENIIKETKGINNQMRNNDNSAENLLDENDNIFSQPIITVEDLLNLPNKKCN